MNLTTKESLSPAGRDLIQHFESCFLKAYQDGGGVWTIGWGHTGLQHLDGTVHKGRIITREEADRLFAYDMEQFERRVEALVKVPLSQAQYDALVSFDFNSGGLTLEEKGKSAPSTLLRKLNAGDFMGAALEFPRWNKDNGKVVNGLIRRRAAEQAVFCGFDWSIHRR
jgi:lysozyme